MHFKALKESILHVVKNKGKRSIELHVTTNGTLLTAERLKFLRKYGVIVTISIDGSRLTHDYNRKLESGPASSFGLVVNNLKKIKSDLKRGLRASLVFNPSNCARLFENLIFLRGLGFNNIDFFPDIYNNWTASRLGTLNLQFKKLISYFTCSIKKCKNFSLDDIFLSDFIRRGSLFGSLNCSKLFLDGKGKFYFCNYSVSQPIESRRNFLIGDAVKGINSGRRLRLLQEKREELVRNTGIDCNICDYASDCGCNIGHFIALSGRSKDLRQGLLSLCSIRKIYISNFKILKGIIFANKKFKLNQNSRGY